MIYYIDPNVNTDGSGISPDSPISDYKNLDLKAGDSVLFKRGSFIRGALIRVAGTPEAHITYGAYGKGTNPVFCGSVDVSFPEKWIEIKPNVWKYTDTLPSEACNFVFDNGRIGATLRWSEDELCAQGDWYSNRCGEKEFVGKIKEDEKLLLYSVGNPAKVYSHIECCVWGNRSLSRNISCTTVQDLIFYASGVHGMAGDAEHMTVRRCSFIFIGGSVWSNKLKVRFGNAIEFWQIGNDILIEDCYFNNIYDSAITHQGTEVCVPAHNLIMRNNLFINHSMAAYEGRDKMSINSSFTGNICINAGGGFGPFGDTTPRNSEIYPEPMGHHIFMWRITEPTENGSLEVSDNIFYCASGACIYNRISADAEAQMTFKNNTYYTENSELLNKFAEKSYSPSEFDKFLAEQGEEGAKYEALDPEKLANAWFERTGCGRLTEPLFTDTI